MCAMEYLINAMENLFDVFIIQTGWWKIVIGYVFSIGSNIIFVRLIVNEMWKPLKIIRTHEPLIWHRTAIGVIDSFMYTTSWIVGKPEFIAIWLAFKIAGRWNVMFKVKYPKEISWYPGKAYNIFHIGNGLTIIFAFMGGYYVDLLSRNPLYIACAPPVIIIILSYLLYLIIKIKQKKYFENN